ncbi:winged helix-turn-helix transcriptional regulator [Devosia sp. PTR5]|uniref:Winged helix-turn-helix transcriptional regulator n=1 Tax=Devosia oryzisoli TaxID=2774138 RepID=A0A927FUI3_9HYPH|nr:metalloregulator ArsR/SmtB family transcription factor [Devosia oryzisoli]MBD8064914.1 winged helix-turn-helix transcriptional regulator [Devosia oryzisoli]
MTRKATPPLAIYSALSDATRCRILEILSSGPVPVHSLADAFAISRPAISRHLRVLKTAGLVAEVKKGRENLYTFRTGRLDQATDWISSFASKQAVQSKLEPPPPKAKSTAKSKLENKVKSGGGKTSGLASHRPAPSANQMGFDF